MEVDERHGTDELIPEPELAAETVPHESLETPVLMRPAWLRLAYSLEFFVALTAIFTVWSQVGGQGHLDLLPWYIKLALTLSLAWCCVRFTAGLVDQPQRWNRRTILWLAGIILISVAMAGITYYYHLHEAPDESDSDDTSTTVSLPRWRL